MWMWEILGCIITICIFVLAYCLYLENKLKQIKEDMRIHTCSLDLYICNVAGIKKLLTGVHFKRNTSIKCLEDLQVDLIKLKNRIKEDINERN